MIIRVVSIKNRPMSWAINRSVLVREPSQHIRIPLMAIVPDSLFAELDNVVWQWIGFRQLPIETG